MHAAAHLVGVNTEPQSSQPTDDTLRALTVIETSERLARRVAALLDEIEPSTNGIARTQVAEARALLYELTSATTNCTASLVKSQALSDKIASAARQRVADALARMNP